MKIKISGLIIAIFAVITISFISCDEETINLVSNESGVKDPVFDDSYGYLRAQSSGLPINTDNPTYYNFSLITTAVFLNTAGASQFSSDGGGIVVCNEQTLTNLYGSYWGGSTDATRAIWNIGGNSNVPAFIDSCNTFVQVTGIDIDSWNTYPKGSDVIVSWIGDTENAYTLYAELEYGGTNYGDGKYLTKKLDPGTLSCTFKASDVSDLYGSDSYSGVTFRLFAYYVDSSIQDSKKYYFINLTLLSHAIYFQ